MNMYDIGIIGGGTAGMTAAIYGQRAGKRTVILENMSFGGQIVSAHNVENYPGIASVSGSEFSMNLLEQATKLGAETALEEVTGIREQDGMKIIETTGKEYSCKTVIIASGVTHRHIGLDKEIQLTGAGVSYCATCDGAFFRSRDVAVIGGGNTALQDAEFLSNFCKKVYLVHRRDEFRGDNSLVELLKKKDNVEFVLSCTPKDIVGETMVEGIILYDIKAEKEVQLDVAGIFVAIGQIPQNQKFADYVKLDGAGFILAAEDCMTSRPGVFAAGDCRTKEVRQLTTAAADGAVAALAACKYLTGV
jgi:thioredoxin reductase (NADPH)